jgi:hypothetical protein
MVDRSINYLEITILNCIGLVRDFSHSLTRAGMRKSQNPGENVLTGEPAQKIVLFASTFHIS